MIQRQEFEKRVYALYARKAARYRFLHGLQTLGVDAYWRNRIARLVMQGHFARLIEPGTGTGLAAAAVLRHGFTGEIVGVDPNERMLANRTGALRGSRRYSAIAASVLELPFPDHSFDGGFSVVGLGGVFDIHRALQELIRVIKPGGSFFAIEMCQPRSPTRRWIHQKVTAGAIRRAWEFRDIEIEPELRKLGLDDYSVTYRSDLGLGSVFELALRIRY